MMEDPEEKEDPSLQGLVESFKLTLNVAKSATEQKMKFQEKREEWQRVVSENIGFIHFAKRVTLKTLEPSPFDEFLSACSLSFCSLLALKQLDWTILIPGFLFFLVLKLLNLLFLAIACIYSHVNQQLRMVSEYHESIAAMFDVIYGRISSIEEKLNLNLNEEEHHKFFLPSWPIEDNYLTLRKAFSQHLIFFPTKYSAYGILLSLVFFSCAWEPSDEALQCAECVIFCALIAMSIVKYYRLAVFCQHMASKKEEIVTVSKDFVNWFDHEYQCRRFFKGSKAKGSILNLVCGKIPCLFSVDSSLTYAVLVDVCLYAFDYIQIGYLDDTLRFILSGKQETDQIVRTSSEDSSSCSVSMDRDASGSYTDLSINLIPEKTRETEDLPIKNNVHLEREATEELKHETGEIIDVSEVEKPASDDIPGFLTPESIEKNDLTFDMKLPLRKELSKTCLCGPKVIQDRDEISGGEHPVLCCEETIDHEEVTKPQRVHSGENVVGTQNVSSVSLTDRDQGLIEYNGKSRTNGDLQTLEGPSGQRQVNVETFCASSLKSVNCDHSSGSNEKPRLEGEFLRALENALLNSNRSGDCDNCPKSENSSDNRDGFDLYNEKSCDMSLEEFNLTEKQAILEDEFLDVGKMFEDSLKGNYDDIGNPSLMCRDDSTAEEGRITANSNCQTKSVTASLCSQGSEDLNECLQTNEIIEKLPYTPVNDKEKTKFEEKDKGVKAKDDCNNPQEDCTDLFIPNIEETLGEEKTCEKLQNLNNVEYLEELQYLTASNNVTDWENYSKPGVVDCNEKNVSLNRNKLKSTSANSANLDAGDVSIVDLAEVFAKMEIDKETVRHCDGVENESFKKEITDHQNLPESASIMSASDFSGNAENGVEESEQGSKFVGKLVKSDKEQRLIIKARRKIYNLRQNMINKSVPTFGESNKSDEKETHLSNATSVEFEVNEKDSQSSACESNQIVLSSTSLTPSILTVTNSQNASCVSEGNGQSASESSTSDIGRISINVFRFRQANAADPGQCTKTKNSKEPNNFSLPTAINLDLPELGHTNMFFAGGESGRGIRIDLPTSSRDHTSPPYFDKSQAISSCSEDFSKSQMRSTPCIVETNSTKAIESTTSAVNPAFPFGHSETSEEDHRVDSKAETSTNCSASRNSDGHPTETTESLAGAGRNSVRPVFRFGQPGTSEEDHILASTAETCTNFDASRVSDVHSTETTESEDADRNSVRPVFRFGQFGTSEGNNGKTLPKLPSACGQYPSYEEASRATKSPEYATCSTQDSFHRVLYIGHPEKSKSDEDDCQREKRQNSNDLAQDDSIPADCASNDSFQSSTFGKRTQCFVSPPKSQTDYKTFEEFCAWKALFNVGSCEKNLKKLSTKKRIIADLDDNEIEENIGLDKDCAASAFCWLSINTKSKSSMVFVQTRRNRNCHFNFTTNKRRFCLPYNLHDASECSSEYVPSDSENSVTAYKTMQLKNSESAAEDEGRGRSPDSETRNSSLDKFDLENIAYPSELDKMSSITPDTSEDENFRFHNSTSASDDECWDQSDECASPNTESSFKLSRSVQKLEQSRHHSTNKSNDEIIDRNQTIWNSKLCMRNFSHEHVRSQTSTPGVDDYELHNSNNATSCNNSDGPVKYSLQYENLSLDLLDPSACLTLRLVSDKETDNCDAASTFSQTFHSSLSGSWEDMLHAPSVSTIVGQSNDTNVVVNERNLSMSAKLVDPEEQGILVPNADDSKQPILATENSLQQSPEDTTQCFSGSAGYQWAAEEDQSRNVVCNPEDNDFKFETDNLRLCYKPLPGSNPVEISFRKRKSVTRLTFKSKDKKLILKTTPPR